MPFPIYEGEHWHLTLPLLTFAMGGAAAFASGKAIAQTWRPFWQVPLYMLALAAAVRFCHFALFEEPLLSLPSYLVDFAIGFCRGGARLSALSAPSRWVRSTAGSIAARGRWGGARLQ